MACQRALFLLGLVSLMLGSAPAPGLRAQAPPPVSQTLKEMLERTERLLSALSLDNNRALWPSDADVEDLFGSAGPAVPQFRMAQSTKRTLLVLGDEVDLSGANVRADSSGAVNVVVVARRIHIQRPAQFELEGTTSGGTLVLVAFERFEGTGQLVLRSRGKDGRQMGNACTGFIMPACGGNFEWTLPPLRFPAESGGNGGSLLIYAGDQKQPDVTITNTGGQPGIGCTATASVKSSTTMQCDPISIGGIAIGGLIGATASAAARCRPNNSCSTTAAVNELKDGVAGTVGQLRHFTDFGDLSATMPIETAWLWTFGAVRKLQFDINQAVRSQEQPRLIALFQKYRNLPQLTLPPDKYEVLNPILQNLSAMRRELLPPLWWKTVNVPAPGLPPTPVTVVTSSDNLLTRVAPTVGLLRREIVNGRSVAGMIQTASSSPDRLVVHFGAELVVDPFLEAAVKEDTSQQGERYDGMFTGCALKGDIERIVGLLDDSVTSINGNVLDATLTLRAESANLFFWRLSSLPGIKFQIRSECATADQRVVPGPSFAISVSTARRNELIVTRDTSQQLKNASPYTVRVNYVVSGDGKPYRLEPALQIEPKGMAPLPDTLAAMSNLRVPPSAIDYVINDPFAIVDDFQVASDRGLFQKIAISNLLPSTDRARGGALRFLELQVEYWDTRVPGGQRAQVGPYRLAPAGSTGSEIALNLIKSPTRTLSLRISGTAYYENGSSSDVVPFETQDVSIKITPDRLK